MRTRISFGRRAILPLGLAGVLAAGMAHAAAITCGTASGLAGQSVEISIGTSDLTGLGVQSYQFALTYDPSQVTATGISTVATLGASAGWSTPTFNLTTGEISVSAAGVTPLSGSGSLVKLEFLINPALLNGGGTGLHVGGFLFNEGSPPVTTADGSISIGVTPQIAVYPNTGEIVRGSTLQFGVTGSVSLPVTWSTTNPSVATINASGLLTGVAPGSVRVTALDNAGHTDTSDGDILIRGMGVTVATASIEQGQSTSVPVSVTSLTGLGVRAGQFEIAYNPSVATFTSATAPPGTLLNGYGSMSAGAANGVISVGFAGTTDLTGSGVLFDLNFSTSTAQSGYTGLALQMALFNETLPALRTSGSLTVSPLPGISLTPNTVTLLAGQTQAYGVAGSPSPPFTWSTLDPSVATINGAGVLTAVAGGQTRVHVVDNVGAQATSGLVTVYDCKLTIPTLSTGAGARLRVPLLLDRLIGGLGVYSVQYTLSYASPWITGGFGEGGLMLAWGASVSNYSSTSLRVASAGSKTLGSTAYELEYVDLDISLLTPPGTVIPLTLTNFLFNEGKPVPQIVNGGISVGPSAGITPGGDAPLALGEPRPNPAIRTARVDFTVPASRAGRAVLAVYALDGRRVRTLFDGLPGAGTQSATWDAADEAGRRVSPGLYFYRLEWLGRHLERKIVLVR
ncbi:MAG TPA: Ig-like domain-containing protein [Candidatus Eisenbacteria bacterium]